MFHAETVKLQQLTWSLQNCQQPKWTEKTRCKASTALSKNFQQMHVRVTQGMLFPHEIWLQMVRKCLK